MQRGDPPFGHVDGANEADWVVAKSLVEANDATRRALEDLLLGLTYRDAVDDEQLCDRLEAAIDRHERALEDLELARQALAVDE